MAILKVMKDSKDFSASVDYCEGLVNTNEPDKCVLKGGYLCNIDKIREQTELTREQFGKNSGRQGKHYSLNFAIDELDKTPEGYQKALEMGLLWAKETFPKNQVGVFVHGNTDNIHCHILVHSLDIETGKKLQVAKNDLLPFKEKANEICNDYGINVILEKDLNAEIEYNNVISAHTPEKSWTEKIKKDIDSVRKIATSFTDFEEKLNEKHISIEKKQFINKNTNEVQNYILFRDLNAEKETGKDRKIKNTRLGKKFYEDELINQFKKNSSINYIETNKENKSIASKRVSINERSSKLPSPKVNLNLNDNTKDKLEALEEKKQAVFDDTRERLKHAQSQEEAQQIKKEEQVKKEFISREKEAQLINDEFYSRMLTFFSQTNQNFPHATKFNSDENSLYMGGLYRTKFKFTYENGNVTFSEKKGEEYEVYKTEPLKSEEEYQKNSQYIRKQSGQHEAYFINIARNGMER